MTNSVQFSLYQKLSSLGSVFSLRREYAVSPQEVKKIISDYQEHFKPYNPRKTEHNRYGLSLTSLDGGFSGVPDLDSLFEYNQLHGTHFKESDFRKWTPFFNHCQSIKDAVKPFHDYIGRSHILKFNKGGFFPYHRDLCDSSFRLFISLCEDIEDYVFILDDKKISFQPGFVYFIDTYLSHSLFSFVDENLFVVFNIDLCEDAVNAVFCNLFAT